MFCVAEEAAEEFAGRVPGPELHRLRDAELNKFLGSLLGWCSGELYSVYANMELMETYYCFCTRLNVTLALHSIFTGVALLPHFFTSTS